MGRPFHLVKRPSSRSDHYVCARVLFINHMPLPRRNAQRPPYALFLEVADPLPVSAHSTGLARQDLRLEKVAFTPKRKKNNTPGSLKNIPAVGFRPVYRKKTTSSVLTQGTSHQKTRAEQKHILGQFVNDCLTWLIGAISRRRLCGPTRAFILGFSSFPPHPSS